VAGDVLIISNLDQPQDSPRLQHVGFVVDKAALGQVSPANHSTDFSFIIITRG
jgi:hypothetical protein